MNDMNQIEIKISNEEINYKEAVLFMESKVRDISENHSKELLWFLSHNHIFTQGTSASDDEILNSDVIEVLKTNRGGKTTYHGPGQRIVYFMLNLNNKKKDIRKFISIIENSVIDFLKNYNVEARAFKDRVGIWVIKNNKVTFDKEKKIGAIGLRVKKWVTYHGMSFNINPNLEYYKFIHSCGLKEYENTSMGVEFAINDALSVSYNDEEFEATTNVAIAAAASSNTKTTVTSEHESIQVAYNLGGATLGLALVEVGNADYTASKDEKKSIFTLAMEF